MTGLDRITKRVEKLEAALKAAASAEVSEVFVKINNCKPERLADFPPKVDLDDLMPGYCRVEVSIKNKVNKRKKLKPVILKSRNLNTFMNFIYMLYPTETQAPLIYIPVNFRDKVVTGKEIIVDDTIIKYLDNSLKIAYSETEEQNDEECSR